ncbi:MAG: hypothetical protein CL946_12185 [Ectothiorhodospiraceae bacterium]|nr:hypothetical protein [Ectothiorhodospiraceae bacterium]
MRPKLCIDTDHIRNLRVDMGLRFLHCADVHLGKNYNQGEERYLDYFRALDSVVEYAVKGNVDAVFIAGDLFDEQSPSAQTIVLAAKSLRPLREAGIRTVAIEGNHDRKKRTESACALDILASEGYLQLLRPDIENQSLGLAPVTNPVEGSLISINGVTIAGLGFIGHNPEKYLQQAAAQLPADTPNVVLYHTMVVDKEDSIGYGYCLYSEIEDLKGRISYLALGHRHTRVGTKDEFDGWVLNPGSLEFVHPYDFRQSHDLRGFYDVTLQDDGSVSAEHIPTKKRPAVYIRVDVTDASTVAAFTEAVLQAVEDGLKNESFERSPIVVMKIEGTLGIARHLIPKAGLVQAILERHDVLHAEIVEGTAARKTEGELLLIDPTDLDNVADRARSIVKEIITSEAIAPGREQELADAIIDLKERFATDSYSLKDEHYIDIRKALHEFASEEDPET